ncbi:MAG: PIN domain-containing protein [Chloroflexi bacterium]|nr:PIN domain-containing protein [Chloroflexota bacterium]
MITAVDTSVLLDVFTADAERGRGSHAALTRCLREGSLVACEVVWAELASGFRDEDVLLVDMERLGVTFEPLDRGAALAAGAAWRSYRSLGGSRQRILADFLIGAHAAANADRLLTRDRGFYRTHFANVTVLDPGDAP